MKHLLLTLLSEIRTALLRPRSFFEKRRTEELFTSAVTALGMASVIYLVLLFLTAALNTAQLRHNMSIVQGMLPPAAREGIAMKFDAFIPWNRLAYPFVFALYVPVVALLRQGAVRLLGDARRSLADMQSITAYATIPIIVGMTLTGALGNLFPVLPEAGKPMHFGAVAVITLLTTLACGIWEAVVSVSACRTVYGQNTGRALLTWFLPWVGLFVIALGATVAFSLAFMGR